MCVKAVPAENMKLRAWKETEIEGYLVSIALMMEAASSSETSLSFYQTKRRSLLREEVY
jgi:hypothetical protein